MEILNLTDDNVEIVRASEHGEFHLNVFVNVSNHFPLSWTGATVLQVLQGLLVLWVLQVPIFYFLKAGPWCGRALPCQGPIFNFH